MTSRTLANPRRTSFSALLADALRLCEADPGAGCRSFATGEVSTPDGPRPACARCASTPSS